MIRTLIADDSAAELDAIVFLLQRTGVSLEMDTAGDGEAALGLMRQKAYDLLITDIRMPFVNGLTLARESRGINPDIRCIIITAHEDFSYARTALSAGVEEYLLKPIDPEEFNRCIRDIAEKITKAREEKEAKRLQDLYLRRQLLSQLRSGREPDADTEALIALCYPELTEMGEREGDTDGNTNTPAADAAGVRIRAVASYIQTHFGEELSLDILAAIVYVNKDYLSRLFKKETGQNLNQYIRQVRMEKAKEYLLATTERISSIAQKVGYPNQSYFGKSFSDYTGMTPEKFREMGGRR